MAPKTKDFSTVSAGRVYADIDSIFTDIEEEAPAAAPAPAQIPAPDKEEAPVTITDVVTILAKAIEQDKAKETPRYSKAQQLDYMERFETSGKKGVKLPRINLAFKPSVYEYVHTMAEVSGVSMTMFVNKVLEDHMQKNETIYEAAKTFRNTI